MGSGRGCPLVVPYWADLQSVHGFRCYGNITQTQNVSEYMLVLAVCLVTLVSLYLIVLLIIPNTLVALLNAYMHCLEQFI